MKEQLPLTPMVYVCVASGHTLPLYEACLARRPSHIILIVSQWAREHAHRLVSQLRRALPEAYLHQPGENDFMNKLAGDSLANDTAWVRRVLEPLLSEARFSGLPRWLNLNGGTKLMSLILSSTLQWDRLDYRATQEHVLRASRIGVNGDESPGLLTPIPEDDCVLPTGITPFDVARLYNTNVRQLPPNPLRKQEHSVPLADEMFNDLEDEQPGLVHILSVLDEIWSRHSSAPKYQDKEISLPLEKFLPQEAEARVQAEAWLHALEGLCPESLRISAKTIVFPGNHRRPGAQRAALKKWVSGDWLEQLTRHWLVKAGIPSDQISENLIAESTEGESASGRETDLLIQYKGNTWLVEIKADVPHGKTEKDLVEQLGSVDKFGMVKKILLIGPLLQLKLVKSGTENTMLHRCISHNIQLAQNQRQLLQSILGKKQPPKQS